MNLTIQRLSAARKTDFYRVHCQENGADWCFCAAWWVPSWEGWGERSAGENHALREQLFAVGEFDGYLLYRDGEPVCWCQCGPRDRLEKLCQAYNLPPDPQAWALTCFITAPAYRGKGLTHAMLEGVLADLKTRGVRYVQAFPRRGADMAPGEVWTGPERLFQKAGFELERDDPQRPVYRLILRP